MKIRKILALTTFIFLNSFSSIIFCAQPSAGAATAADTKQNHESSKTDAPNKKGLPDPQQWIKGENRRPIIAQLKRKEVLPLKLAELSFVQAVNHNDHEFVTLFLRTQPHIPNVDFIDPADGEGTLHTACSFGYEKIVDSLLKSKKVTVNKQGTDGNTPLIIAARKRHCTVGQLLLQSGAEVNTQNKRGYTALHYGALNNCLPVVTMLLAGKARADIITYPNDQSPGTPPLECAILSLSAAKIPPTDQDFKMNAQIKNLLKKAAPHVAISETALQLERTNKKQRQETIQRHQKVTAAPTEQAKQVAKEELERFQLLAHYNKQIDALSDQLVNLQVDKFRKEKALARLKSHVAKIKQKNDRLAQLKAKEILFGIAREHKQKKKAFAQMLQRVRVDTRNYLDVYYEMDEIYKKRKELALQPQDQEMLRKQFYTVYQNLKAVGYTGWERKRAIKRFYLLGMPPKTA